MSPVIFSSSHTAAGKRIVHTWTTMLIYRKFTSICPTLPWTALKKVSFSSQWFYIRKVGEKIQNVSLECLCSVTQSCLTLCDLMKTKIMASGPITSWQIDGETVETVADFILGASKITAGGDCSHEIKRCLFLGRKVMTNLDSIFKSRDITLPTKVRLVKTMVFPVVMYGCESWTV